MTRTTTAPDELDHPAQFDTLSPEQQAALLEWIRLSLVPAKTASRDTSYGLKHHFQHHAFYVVNGAFKGAMLAAGYEPTRATRNAPNWCFHAKPACPRAKVPKLIIYCYGAIGPWHRPLKERLAFYRRAVGAKPENATHLLREVEQEADDLRTFTGWLKRQMERIDGIGYVAQLFAPELEKLGPDVTLAQCETVVLGWNRGAQRRSLRRAWDEWRTAQEALP